MLERLRFLSWSQRVGLVFGATYLLVGVAGLIVTAGVGFASTSGKDLIFFELNPLHNLVHLGIGAALVLAARAEAASKLMNRLIGGTYLLVAIVGTIVVQLDTTLFRGLISQRSDLNILALNHPDNLLHLASFAVLVGSTFVGRRRAAGAVEARSAVPPVAASKRAGKMPVLDEPEAAESPRANDDLLWEGTIVPRTGTYRCVCEGFAVAIKKGREFPNCPEDADVDHYFRLTKLGQPSNSTRPAPGKRKATARSTATAGARRTRR